jgi:hypothetical protein
MAALFSGLSGIRQPDALFNNGGPLPPSSAANLQTGFNGTTSAHINTTSSLLNNMNPYTYGESDRISSDVNYKNTPVKVQKIVPMLQIPLATSNHTARLSHSVDDGDVAFVLRREGTANSQHSTPGQDIIVDSKLATKMSRVVDAIINLPTLNYLLTLLQTTEWNNPHHTKRIGFFTELGLPTSDPFWSYGTHKKSMHFLQKVHAFGSVIGSEKQGGQHEAGSNVDWPVNFITTICVDGFCDNLVNFWRNVNVHAGDDLVLHLEEVDVVRFDLNHYYKNKFPTQTFDEPHKCWQLIPRVRNIVTQDPKHVLHFARSQMSAAPMHVKPVQNAQIDTLNMCGGLMQVTVQPSILGGVYGRSTLGTETHTPTTVPWSTARQFGRKMHQDSVQVANSVSKPLFREHAAQMLLKKRSIHESQCNASTENTNRSAHAPVKKAAAPAPLKAAAPAPLKAAAPAPLKAAAPAPLKVVAPAPQKAASPAPLKVVAPAPLKVAAPAPLKVVAPAPQKAASPAPQKAAASAHQKPAVPTLQKPADVVMDANAVKQSNPSIVKAIASGISKAAGKASSAYKASPKSNAPISASIEGGSGAVAHVLGSADSKVLVEKL